MPANCTVASPLSQSQKDIWALLSRGLTVSNIAEKLKELNRKALTKRKQ